MAILKRQFKKILGLTSIAVLLTSISIGILIKEKNNPKASSFQLSSGDYQFENRNSPDFNAEIERPKTICSDLLEEDENSFALREYSKMEVVECMSVGCGGIF